MALLASYVVKKETNETLEEFLSKKVFKNVETFELCASSEEIIGFNEYINSYKKLLAVEKLSVEVF